MRKGQPKRLWTEDEIKSVSELYRNGSKQQIFAALPNRTFVQITNKAQELGITRSRPPKRTDDQVREAKRIHMAKRRMSNPQAARDYSNRYHALNRESEVRKMREYYARRFFWGRAMKLRGPNRATTKEIASLWKKQKGLCALTGRKLDRTAQLDHILPRARGGGDEMKNLRWTCEQVNIIKRHLTDDEFITACKDVVRYANEQRIQLVDSIPMEV